ncbi:MAG: hypothetical protein Q7T81_14415 [Pseudolabrys sp.]|nr:hypothetical protein [Pseudolabrys sp.]
MMFLHRGIGGAAAALALMWAIPAGAQENFYANKTPVQIFATDCAMCHKTPQSLAKAGGPLGLGLEGFLRSHYTASRESAALMARYLQSMDAPAPAADRRRGGPGAKPAGAKPAAKKPAAAALPGENKPAEAKPVEAPKPSETKPADASKPAE